MDTPIVDAEEFQAHIGNLKYAGKLMVVPARVARQLERELAEARKDAERYRWLNSQDNFLAYIEQPDGTKRYRLKCGEPLDRWIDSELSQSGDNQAHVRPRVAEKG